jgi:hypothetical protein
MERLTKKELRALLECIKECYPICDLETFRQRVVSRLSKILLRSCVSYQSVDESVGVVDATLAIDRKSGDRTDCNGAAVTVGYRAKTSITSPLGDHDR